MLLRRYESTPAASCPLSSYHSALLALFLFPFSFYLILCVYIHPSTHCPLYLSAYSPSISCPSLYPCENISIDTSHPCFTRVNLRGQNKMTDRTGLIISWPHRETQRGISSLTQPLEVQHPCDKPQSPGSWPWLI